MKIKEGELSEIVGAVTGFLANADEYLAAGEQIVSAVEPSVIKALKLLIKTLNEVRSNLEPELALNSLLGAKAMHRDYKNYEKAGFNKNQAFALVLASVKPFNFTELVNSASSSVQKVQKKMDE